MCLKTKSNNESGFSFIELMLVIVIVGIISATAYIKHRPEADSGAAERAVESVASTVAMRRDEAIRLNGLTASTSLETSIAPLVELDFTDRMTTASLIINGTDANNDGYDDDTGEQLTFLTDGGWKYSYRNNALELPVSWKVVGIEGLTVGPIGDGKQMGVPVTKIGFDGDGRVYGFTSEGWEKYPARSSMDADSAPFWAVYLESQGYDQRGETQAVAVAVYPSGQIEKFRFDGATWRGWRGRAAQ